MSMRREPCGGILAEALLFAATLFAATLFAGIAWGQVAAPSLTPFSFVTENPAAVQWGSPSRVGAGVSQAQALSDPTNPAQPRARNNLSGGGGGLRWVGQVVSAAAEYSHADNAGTPHNEGEFSDDSRVALGLRLASFLTLGAGQVSQTVRTFQLGVLGEDAHEIPQYGLSLRLGEWLFLGGAAGQDFVKHTDLLTPANGFKTSRDVATYGAGIRTGGAVATHIEYYTVEHGKFAKKNLGVTGRQTAGTGVAEFNFGGFLLGYATTHTTQDAAQPTIDNDRLDIGYAPFSGWTVVARGELAKLKFPQATAAATGTNSITTTSYSLLVTYLFKS
jgi:hypothetical protein